MQEKMLTNSHINIKLFSFKLIENEEYILNILLYRSTVHEHE